MDVLSGVLIISQLLFTVVAGLYFYSNLKTQNSNKISIQTDSKSESEKIKKMRAIQLNKPLSEETRPTDFSEIIGQEKGIKALKAALCGPNPQHIIIYGQPGIGKTAAARLALEVAKNSPKSPFSENAPFIEVDATILQFDERSIADPLIGSVHDPIYQGAGSYGQAGIPQPKAGAVTNAHGGVLFIDEIGELHQIQMNKLLKVLEDRKVTLSSSYYSKENKNIPKHIHDLFTNGLPADFRLIGATTRRPEEIPPALRSRCTEVFFRGLNSSEVQKIAANACEKAGFTFDNGILEVISQYCGNGRDTVNIIQTAASLSLLEDRTHIKVEDIDEVIEYGRYSPNLNKKVLPENKIGVANGLAVFGSESGMLLEIEVNTNLARESGKGVLKITGIIEEEEINSRNGRMRRSSTAKNSVENVITLIGKVTGINVSNYDIHLNFPGGIPIDGPSAGTAIFVAVYSSFTEKEVSSKVAMTGEISIKGRVCPVGGVSHKIEAAIEAGVEKVLIPKDNYQKAFNKYPINIITIESVNELLEEAFESNLLVKDYEQTGTVNYVVGESLQMKAEFAEK